MTDKAPSPRGADRPAPKLVIIAKKDLHANTRVVRQCRAACQAGYSVEVYSEHPPEEGQCAALPGVTFHAVSRRLTVRDAPHVVLVLGGLAVGRLIGPRHGGKLLRALLSAVLRWGRSPSPVPPAKSASERAGAVAGGAGAVSGGLTRRLLRNFARRPLGQIGFVLASDVAFARRIQARARVCAGDVVQAHDSHALPAAECLAARVGAPLVYDAVENPTGRGGWSAAPAVDRRAMIAYAAVADAAMTPSIRAAAAVFTVGPTLAEWMRDHYQISTPILLRNCRLEEAVDPEGSPLRRACAVGAADLLLLSLNTIGPGSGSEMLVEALALLPRHVHLACLGPAPDVDYVHALRSLAARRGVDQRLHLLSPVPSSAVVRWAAGADVGVIALQATSLNNRMALPNRVFELIAARIPMAVSNLPDIASLVTEYGIGAVFHDTTGASIARACDELLHRVEDPVLRSRVDAAARMLTWERESEAYLAGLRAARRAPEPTREAA